MVILVLEFSKLVAIEFLSSCQANQNYLVGKKQLAEILTLAFDLHQFAK